MKSEFFPGQPPAPKLFPRVMKSHSNGAIVVFITEKEGTVLHAGSGSYYLGQTKDTWVPCDDATTWAPVNPGDKLVLTF